MAYYQGFERSEAVWQELREELAAFTINVSGVLEWQEAFVACQEFKPESEAASPLPTVKDDSFVAASASKASEAWAAASASTASKASAAASASTPASAEKS